MKMVNENNKNVDFKPPGILELTIESIGFEGKAIARDRDGFVYFVEGGVPGDVVLAEVRKRKKTYAEARISELLTPSSVRTVPFCRYFGTCGGCKWQHLAYLEQCTWKRQNVEDAFGRLGKVAVGTLHDTLAAEQDIFYRNKMEFSFGDSRWLMPEEIAEAKANEASGAKARFDRTFALGLHVPGRYDKVLDVHECFLQSPVSNTIVNAVRAAALERSASIYQTRTYEGFLRNLVIRTSVATGEIMVILVTSPAKNDSDTAVLQWFEQNFVELFPEVSTAIHAVNANKGAVATGEPRVVHGSGFITETLLGVQYRISPFSFFQTNTRQAERLFRVALDYAGDLAGKTVWDLYCGTGSITLAAAREAKFVAGIEIVESSIRDARANAAMNGIQNVEFFVEDMQKAVKQQLLSRLPAPDVIIVDPPRAGLHPDVVANLAAVAAPRLVYVSCNPATQARDCALLAEIYNVDEVQPVDMFPHTYHIESVACLRLRDGIA
jgi:23S rRNA (uracil1939-C5)-methyltransferase